MGGGGFTPRKTNVSLENEWLENVFPIEIVPFYGTFVCFRGFQDHKSQRWAVPLQ